MDILTQILRRIEAKHPSIKPEIGKLEEEIRQEFGSEQHYIASPAALKRALRDAEIRRQHHAFGVSVADLAARTGLTPRQVRNIIAGPD